jgi:hypothetical protein
MSDRAINLVGQKFGRLTVIERAENNKHRHPRWACECACGKHVVVVASSLTNGLSKSCGCLHHESVAARNRKHGHAVKGRSSATYRSWMAMRSRCKYPSQPHYKDYGGRGITTCERWETFENFLADMGPRPSSKHSIDRINPEGNYEPTNCRWATSREQSNNRRSNRLITAWGRTRTIAKWAREVGIARKTIAYRLLRGWKPEDALTRPPRNSRVITVRETNFTSPLSQEERQL